MLFWLAVAVMTSVAIFAVLWPLARVRQASVVSDASDLAVYRDQMAEIDRDLDRGLIAPHEASAARTEVSRRLLAAAERAEATSPEAASGATLRRRIAAVIALGVLPAIALGTYLRIGNPEMPAQPLAARLQAPPDQQDMATMIARVERHLAQNPDDGRGWEILAPIHLRLGRPREAATAWAQALRTLGPSAERFSGLGEAQMALAGGIVTAEAKASFRLALELDRQNARARYFTAMALAQDGDRAGALAGLQAMLADGPADAPWRATVERDMARLATEPLPAPAAPGPTSEQAAAAADMPAEQRQEMIRGMVERLSERLKREGGDAETWARLVRAYVVLGEPDRARTALVEARTALGTTPEAARLESLVREMGLGS